MSELRIFPVLGVKEIVAGDNLVEVFLSALDIQGETVSDRDVVVVTSKVVSKSEGRIVPFDGTDENKKALVEAESRRVLRRRGTLFITETHHGFINANAGVDLSNTNDGTAVLLPEDPDRSARRFRGDLQRARGVTVGVIVTDTFGRVWRQGVTDVALGIAGLKPVLDLRGTRDANGRQLEATEVSIVDEIAGAANLVLQKANATPFCVVRGLSDSYFGEGSVKEHVVRGPNEDLFR